MNKTEANAVLASSHVVVNGWTTMRTDNSVGRVRAEKHEVTGSSPVRSVGLIYVSIYKWFRGCVLEIKSRHCY